MTTALIATAVAGLLSGTFWKIWDDVTDNAYLPPGSLKLEFIKTLMIITCTIYFMLDVFVAITFICVAIPLNAATKGIDHPVWVSLSALPIVTIPFSLCILATDALFSHWELKIAVMILYLFAMLVDHYGYPEETSTRKTMGRAITCMCLVLAAGAVLVVELLAPMRFSIPFTCFSIGYLAANLIFHTWVHTPPPPVVTIKETPKK